jgi:hypothetical protein
VEKNTVATVALGSGIGIIVLQLLLICTGMIPIVNLLGIIIAPVMFICDIVAIVAGFMGLKKAKLLNGQGKGPAMAGLIIGILHVVFVVVMVIVGIVAGGAMMIMGNM